MHRRRPDRQDVFHQACLDRAVADLDGAAGVQQHPLEQVHDDGVAAERDDRPGDAAPDSVDGGPAAGVDQQVDAAYHHQGRARHQQSERRGEQALVGQHPRRGDGPGGQAGAGQRADLAHGFAAVALADAADDHAGRIAVEHERRRCDRQHQSFGIPARGARPVHVAVGEHGPVDLEVGAAAADRIAGDELEAEAVHEQPDRGHGDEQPHLVFAEHGPACQHHGGAHRPGDADHLEHAGEAQLGDVEP